MSQVRPQHKCSILHLDAMSGYLRSRICFQLCQQLAQLGSLGPRNKRSLRDSCWLALTREWPGSPLHTLRWSSSCFPARRPVSMLSSGCGLKSPGSETTGTQSLGLLIGRPPVRRERLGAAGYGPKRDAVPALHDSSKCLDRSLHSEWRTIAFPEVVPEPWICTVPLASWTTKPAPFVVKNKGSD
jgi:hypothetical protein